MWNKHDSEQFNRDLDHPSNGQPDSALVAMGKRFLKFISMTDATPRPEFRDRLLADLLAARASATNMSPAPTPSSSRWQSTIFQTLGSFFSGRRYVYVTSLLVLFAVISTSILGNLNHGQNFLAGFSQLIVSPAYAMENFVLAPEQVDSLGVSPDGSYLLTSKTELATSLIKSSLRVDPNVAISITSLSKTSWRIAPKTALPSNIIFKVSLASSFVDDAGSRQERDYAWAFQVRDTFHVLSTIPRDHSTGVPIDTGIELKLPTDQISLTDFEQHFSIAPKVTGKFELHGRTVVFVPIDPLAEQTIYTITITKGFSSQGSQQSLTSDFAFSFETQTKSAANPTYFSISSSLDASTFEPPQIQIYSDLTSAAEIKVYSFGNYTGYVAALTARDALPWWSSARQQYTVDVSKLKSAASFSIAPTIKNDYLHVLNFPEKLPAGWYVVSVNFNGNLLQTFLQVTDLAVYVDTSKTSSVIWVNDLITKKPVSHAQVSIQELGEIAVTGEDGVASFTTPKSFDPQSNRDHNRSWYAVVRDTNRAVVIKVAGTDGGFGNFYLGENPLANADDYWHYLSTDRPRYQANDILHAFGVIKDRQTGKVPASAELVLIKEGYVDYWYQPVQISTIKVVPDNLGSFVAELPFKNLRSDYYTLELRVAGVPVERKYISIDPYVKPAYQISATADRTILFPDETAQITTKATFFEGTPLPNLKLTTDQTTNELTTDASGLATFPYQAPACSGSDCHNSATVITITPSNSETADVSTQLTIQNLGSRTYQRLETTYPQSGQAQIKIIARQVDRAGLLAGGGADWGADYNGKQPATGNRVDVTVTKTIFSKVETGTWYDFIAKRSYKSYRYDQKQIITDNFSGTTDGVGEYSKLINLERGVNYQVAATVYDPDGRGTTENNWLYYFDGTSFDAQNSADRPYYHLDDNKNTLDYNQYNQLFGHQVGEQVTMRFLNNDQPLPGSTAPSFLYLQSQNGLQEWSTSSQPEYQFNFERRDAPNVSVTGVWFSGSSYVTADSSAAYDLRQSALNVDIQLDRQSYTPGQSAIASIFVTNKSGQPVAADVNVKVVDEAYYAIAADDTAPTNLYIQVGSGTWYTSYTHRAIQDLFGGAEKGGGGGDGGIRATFKDVALYALVHTGANGRASLPIQLPDNITTWRVTGQAVTAALEIGSAIAKFPVTKPAFIDPVAPAEVLVADQPAVVLRAYGAAFSAGDNVKLGIQSPFLNRDIEKTAKAFERTVIDLGSVPVGSHQVTYQLTSSKGNDAVRLPLRSVISHLAAKTVVANGPLSVSTTLPDPQDQPLTVSLSDVGQNEFYQPLANLAYSYGGRIDQQIAARKATELLANYYGETAPLPEVTIEQNGFGIKLLPYSDEDPALSAMVADIAPELIDRDALRQYFLSHADAKDVTASEVADILHGLAAIGDPVLAAAQGALAAHTDFSARDRLAVALALERAGDLEGARATYNAVLHDAAVRNGDEIAIKTSNDNGEITEATALAMLLAARLDLPETNGLRLFIEHRAVDYPAVLEQVGAAAAQLPKRQPSPAAVEYTLAGHTEQVNLTGNHGYSFEVQPELTSSVKFTKVQGDVQFTVAAVRPLAASELGATKGLTISRQYFVDGQSTTTFHQGDLVEVRLTPVFSKSQTDLHDSYELTDLLPSGLAQTGFDSRCVWSTRVSGQRVQFQVDPSSLSNQFCPGKFIRYFARVSDIGSFQAEPAIIQSNRDVTIRSHSATQSVIIK